ncbi:MAG: hypothetical protein Q8K34_00845 [Hydrogenophaga sp.]|nr:hypothetical protein [Hydrogenophaga sp.]
MGRPRIGVSTLLAGLLACAAVQCLAQSPGAYGAGRVESENRSAEVDWQPGTSKSDGMGDVSGHWRGTLLARKSADQGPLAEARRLSPTLGNPEASTATLDVALLHGFRLDGLALNTRATVQQHWTPGQASGASFSLDEAVLSGAGPGNGYWSAGRKVVAWDVGHAFRPNDTVQQEARRTLVPANVRGRPLLMVEGFDADTAWGLVWVNPGRGRQAAGAHEPALAARVFRRTGSVDWHGFVRHGQRTGASAGLAAAWVPGEALSLHASVRRFQRHDTVNADAWALGPALVAANPWRVAVGGAGTQAVLGGSWTGAGGLSVLMEAWYDATAPGADDWRRWTQRQQDLRALAAAGAPVAAVAGNLAWQTGALGASPSLHRRNLFTRLSWTDGPWQPSLDWLYHPADRGHMFTLALHWQGDRVRVEGGLRVHGGPGTAVLRQIPVQQQAYTTLTWAF